MTQLYTSSRLRVLRACPRQHHYRYTLGLQTEANDIMRFGTVGHSALEAWYRVWMDEFSSNDERLPEALAAIAASSLSPFDKIKLSVLVTAYHHRWGSEDWEILAVEVEFRYMLGDHTIAGKIDAIIRNRKDGRVYVVEHKTTGSDASAGSPYWERLAIDSQVSIYIDGAGMLGYDVAGCIYDVLKRPAHERKLMTPDESRKYTAGKGCRACGGSAGGRQGIVQGRGHTIVSMPDGSVRQPPCADCNSTGWRLDADGNPQAPRLYAHLRDADETADEFEARLVEAIAEDPDSFLMRGIVVRLDHELPAMRQDTLDAIAIEHMTHRNPDACVRGQQMCGYFALCSGAASVDSFQSGPAHPELAA